MDGQPLADHGNQAQDCPGNDHLPHLCRRVESHQEDQKTADDEDTAEQGEERGGKADCNHAGILDHSESDNDQEQCCFDEQSKRPEDDFQHCSKDSHNTPLSFMNWR